MSVAEMKNGEIKKIIGFTDEELSLKLMEMGCLPGTSVSINYTAPLGDPMCVQIEGYDLSLRLVEASSITVE